MPKFIDQSDMLTIANTVLNKVIESGLIAGVFIGYVSHNDTSFPTTRPDGTAIKNTDYVKPAASSIYPFTIQNVTFTNRFCKASYTNNNWVLETSAVPNTNDVTVADPTSESLSGTALTQSDINKENKVRFNYTHEQLVPKQIWEIHHNLGYNPSVTIVNSDGNSCIANIEYINNNVLTAIFSELVSGNAYLS